MLIFKKPTETEFRQVRRLVTQYQLTTDELVPDNFTILKGDEKLLAFGSLRMIDNYAELDCIGEVEGHRGKGWGKMLIKKLLETGPDTIYCATSDAKYYEQFNFTQSKQVPRELQRKVTPIELIPGGKPVPKNRIRAMVYSKKK